MLTVEYGMRGGVRGWVDGIGLTCVPFPVWNPHHTYAAENVTESLQHDTYQFHPYKKKNFEKKRETYIKPVIKQ